MRSLVPLFTIPRGSGGSARDELVRLAMDRRRRLCVAGFDEAEDPSITLVD